MLLTLSLQPQYHRENSISVPAPPSPAEPSSRKRNAERSSETSDLTFGFVVGKLVVGEAKPSLLEVLHSKAVSPLCSLYHESDGKTD